VDALAPLRAKFLKRAAEDLATLKDAGVDGETLKYLVHRLAGSAGMFGYPEVSRLAAIVDDALQDGGGADPADLAALIAAVEVLPQA
jgi:HPt (histidine-containing phosphotransfer) domain-containing protein